MDGVGTPIIGRPQPLPGHNTPNATPIPSIMKNLQTSIVGMRLIARLKCPDIADRKILGNWEGDLIIGQDGASACVAPG